MNRDPRGVPATEELDRRARALEEAFRAGDPDALERVRRSYPFPRLRGRTDEVLRAEYFTNVDAHQVLAVEHGYDHWGALLNDWVRPVDAAFEDAITAVITGDEERLRTLLDERPDLVTARSSRRHAATLLHYVAANGVEDERQKTPPNAPAIARLLLERGAEPDALAGTYAGGLTNTPLYLLVSSDHPKRAGVQGALVETLCAFGADPNGILADGLPLTTAIVFGSPDAIQALVRRGARLDHPVLAAASGDLEALERSLHAVTCLRNHSLQLTGERREALDHALCYASMHGRRTCVSRLLEVGASVAGEVDLAQTALHWAAHGDHVDVLDLLLEAGADPRRRDRRWHSSPLGWAEAGGARRTFERLARRADLDLIDACVVGSSKRVLEILEHGLESADGYRDAGIPLRTAAEKGDSAIVETLLQHGADPMLANEAGMTALAWARRNGHDDTVARLVAAGARE